VHHGYFWALAEMNQLSSTVSQNCQKIGISSRQNITARSSAEAEIYATNECTKQPIQLSYIIKSLPLNIPVMTLPSILLYNDNSAYICWSKATTTKGLWHVQIRENAIQESVLSDFITVKHIKGKVIVSDLFTKEDKDMEHFITIIALTLELHIFGCAHPLYLLSLFTHSPSGQIYISTLF
jgi:hypothetical protein